MLARCSQPAGERKENFLVCFVEKKKLEFRIIGVWPTNESFTACWKLQTHKNCMCLTRDQRRTLLQTRFFFCLFFYLLELKTRAKAAKGAGYENMAHLKVLELSF